VTSDLPETAEDTAKTEESVLKDENVALGARLFRSVKIKGDRISKEHPHWRTLGGKSLPRLVVVDTSGKKVGGLEGNDLTSASKLFKLMQKASAKTYRNDLEKVVKESRSLLDDMDRIEAKLAQVAEQRKSASGAKDRALEQEQSELTTEMEAVKARETALLRKVDEERKVTKS
jgi:hypothetical protein